MAASVRKVNKIEIEKFYTHVLMSMKENSIKYYGTYLKMKKTKKIIKNIFYVFRRYLISKDKYCEAQLDSNQTYRPHIKHYNDQEVSFSDFFPEA